VAGGGRFLDEGNAGAGSGSAGDFGQENKRLSRSHAPGAWRHRGRLDAIAQVLQTDGQLTAEQWIEQHNSAKEVSKSGDGRVAGGPVCSK